MGVHTNYKPGEILWFLRNYWKYDRNRLIEEYQNHFQDANFGRSQYTWLRARYGMKEEWGAVLNHPPYSGAVPGGTNTQYYEASSVPNAAPRPNFKRNSESASPPTQSAQDFAPPQSSFQFSATSNMSTLLQPFSPHASTAASKVVGQQAMKYTDPSSGLTLEQPMGAALNTNMNSGMAFYSGQTPVPGMHTALNTSMNTGVNTGMNSSLHSLPGAAPGTGSSDPSTNTGHVNGSHHTYSFPMSANLVPYSAVSTSMTGGNQAMDLSQMSMGMNLSMDVNAQALAYNMEPWGLGMETSYPQPLQNHQKQQSFSMHPNTNIQSYTPSAATMPAAMPIHTSSSFTDSLATMNAAVQPKSGHSTSAASSVTGNSKRKLPEFDIELREPQKRQMLASNPSEEHISGQGAGAHLVAATLTTTLQNAQENQARKTVTGRRKKHATVKTARSMSIPELGASPATAQAEKFTSTTPSPASSGSAASSMSRSASQASQANASRAESPAPTTAPTSAATQPPVTTIDPRGEWFDGAHPNCPILLRHRHDSSGGIYVVTGSPQQPSLAQSFESFESSHSSSEQQPEAGMAHAFPLIEQAVATASPSYEFVPTPVPAPAPTEDTGDASFMYATPLSTTDSSTGASAADVEQGNPTTAATEEASAASPAATSLFGSPLSLAEQSAGLDPVAQVLTMSGPAASELNIQPFDQNANDLFATAPAPASRKLTPLSEMPELDGVWDAALNSLTDADFDGFWSTGVVPFPTNHDGSPVSLNSGAFIQNQQLGTTTAISAISTISAGLPSPAPTALMLTELDSSLMQFDTNTFGMADSDINALLSEIHA